MRSNILYTRIGPQAYGDAYGLETVHMHTVSDDVRLVQWPQEACQNAARQYQNTNGNVVFQSAQERHRLNWFYTQHNSLNIHQSSINRPSIVHKLSIFRLAKPKQVTFNQAEAEEKTANNISLLMFHV